MTAHEAIEIASAHASEQGYDPAAYAITARQNDEWEVYFEGKALLPGDFFTIYVDNESRVVTRLFPGK